MLSFDESIPQVTTSMNPHSHTRLLSNKFATFPARIVSYINKRQQSKQYKQSFTLQPIKRHHSSAPYVFLSQTSLLLTQVKIQRGVLERSTSYRKNSGQKVRKKSYSRNIFVTSLININFLTYKVITCENIKNLPSFSTLVQGYPPTIVYVIISQILIPTVTGGGLQTFRFLYAALRTQTNFRIMHLCIILK